METKTRRFVVELSVVDTAEPDEAMQAAEDLLDAFANAALPAWVFSVDGVDPAGPSE